MQIEHLMSIVEQLGSALEGLDAIGANITAAHVDAALHALQSEVRTLSLESAYNFDFAELDSMAESIFERREATLLFETRN